MPAFAIHFRAVDYFLRADPEGLGAWVQRRESRLVWFCIIAVVVGAGPYGAVVGCWWGPLQAFYVAIKLPLLILLTTLGNGLLNGMLAPLLGLNISFRQSLTVVLVSFAYAALVLGAFSLLALFIIWNIPPLSAATSRASPEYALLQLSLVVFIAFAGIVGNVRLLPLLRQMAASRSVAHKVLIAWLAGNLFLGGQLCWVLRPFIWGGSPVQFIGQEYLHGSFYETVFNALKRVVF